ncbi:MAG: nucleotidyl transferase AbiEii/AbiGii toxin family protein [Thermodesulfobacteriota bacterium]
MYNFVNNMANQPFPKKLQQGALLQLILLHTLYSQRGSDQLIFQGGTALRWIYGGQRASEDLDFVSAMPPSELRKLLNHALPQTRHLALSQFGLGTFEEKPRHASFGCFRTFILFSPNIQRERINVRIEVEEIQSNRFPAQRKIPMMDCPQVFNVMKEGVLTFPFSSSILVVETPEEILTDKLRALYERPYLKGRDLYDLWFLHSMLGVKTHLEQLDRKFKSYVRPLRVARRATFFLKKESKKELLQALKTDLGRFLPSSVYKVLETSYFASIFQSIEEILSPLIKEGLEDLLNSYAQTVCDRNS